MPAIGHVTRTSNGGFKGQLRTLSIKANVEIAPNESKSNDVHPDFRVFSDGIEIGAGWNRSSCGLGARSQELDTGSSPARNAAPVGASRDPLAREGEADRRQRGADTLAAFRDRFVGQPDDDERRQARRQLDLDLDRAGFEAEIGDSGDGRDHQAPPPGHPALVRIPPSAAEPR